ncbi:MULTISPECIES: LysR substrate-binding domain-containing protein [unclassified Serratia (in: enterobacteria)]|uniref:LysR substrate-binding domain-containing protein n=1 Tax=unclassified Serratia (in: enterobacteria) TaxID=2647522 RepID=UPI003076381E
MRQLPKLQQLKAFQQVIRCGSIRAAARALDQSQPAISRSIQELEQTLKTQLIVRGSKGMTLTPNGHIFALRVQLVIEELQRATEEIQQLDQRSQGSLAIGCSSLLAVTLLPKLVELFKASTPQANLLIREAQLSTLLPALQAGKLDFAVGTSSPELPLQDLVLEPLFSAPFCVIARRGHPLAQATTLHELHEAKWLLPETDMGYYQQLQTLLGNFYQQLSQRPIRSDSAVCGLNMVLKADYLTIVARAMNTPFYLHQELVALPIDDLPQAQYCVLYSQKSPLTVTARRFLDLLRSHCQHYPW